MAFDWLIKTEYFIIFPQNSYFWAQVSQDSPSCDEVTLARLQVNPSVRTAGPVMFHNDCYLVIQCSAEAAIPREYRGNFSKVAAETPYLRTVSRPNFHK